MPETIHSPLVGSKRAFRIGDGPIVVSPAMYDLMRHADPDELRRLLACIEVTRLAPVPSLLDLLPVTRGPSAWE